MTIYAYVPKLFAAKTLLDFHGFFLIILYLLPGTARGVIQQTVFSRLTAFGSSVGLRLVLRPWGTSGKIVPLK